jgi:hypothetical protein
MASDAVVVAVGGVVGVAVGGRVGVAVGVASRVVVAVAVAVASGVGVVGGVVGGGRVGVVVAVGVVVVVAAMKVLRTTTVPISRLRLPGNWRAFLAEPATEECAAALLAAQPVVRASDQRLLSGKLEVAAREKLGLEEVLVKMVDCTEAEAQAIEAADAGGNRNEITLLLVDHLTAEGGGRGAARRAVAETQGIQPESVRMREYRASKSRRKESAFNDLGVPIVPEWLDTIEGVQEQLDGVIAKVVLAKGALTRMVKQGAPLPQRVAHLQEELGRLGTALRGMRPAMLCPYCKGLDKVRAECSGCEALGYLGEDLGAGVPAEFLGREPRLVIYRGEVVPWEEARGPEPETFGDVDGVVWPL